MAILNMTTMDSLLKEHYGPQAIENLVYKNNPFLALLPKYEKFGGRNMPLPLVYGNPQNRSATFATAVALADSTRNEQFTLTRVKNYALAHIDGETLKASQGDANAFIDAVTLEVDGAINALSNDLAFSLARDSSGYRAQVLAEPAEASDTVITLKNIKDIVGFELGQVIVIYSAKSGGSQRIYDTSVTTSTVVAIDRSAGTVTLDETYTSSGTIAANDYMFVDGDRGLKVSGLESWIPDSAPDSTSFFGVDRSSDVVRLGGVRTTGTGMPIEEALVQGAEDVAVEGGTPDFCFLNYKQYAKLIKSLGSNVQYIDLDVNGVVGFRGVMIHGSHGPIKVVPDRTIRDSRAYMLQMDTWKLCSLGAAVQLLDDDDQKILRAASTDSYSARIGSYSQLGCVAPGFNGVITLD